MFRQILYLGNNHRYNTFLTTLRNSCFGRARFVDELLIRRFLFPVPEKTACIIYFSWYGNLMYFFSFSFIIHITYTTFSFNLKYCDFQFIESRIQTRVIVSPTRTHLIRVNFYSSSILLTVRKSTTGNDRYHQKNGSVVYNVYCTVDNIMSPFVRTR